MEYQKPNYQELLKRIYTTPSVLFLGQKYLSEALCASGISTLATTENEAQCLLNYREILSLRWNAIVSSSFDANIPGKCGESFSFETRYKYDKAQKIDKTVNAGYFLFSQCCNGRVPSKPDLELDTSHNDTFSAVLKKTIDSYGIVVISGWDLENDWITPKNLYDVLKDAPEQSVLLFGIQHEKALENKFIKELTKKQLSDKDIIEDTLYSFLQQNSFFDTYLEDENFYSDTNVETLSLYSNEYKDGRIPFVLKVQEDAIYELNSKSITILTDNIGANTVSKNSDNLLRLCACKGDWSYYAPHNKLIIDRQVAVNGNTANFYEYISKFIDNIAKKRKKKNNHFLCVTGIHYSGKTAMLKSFALKNKNKYPIFYIENYVDGVSEKLITDFCINSIKIPEGFSREVIVICDFKSTSDYQMQKICQLIKTSLIEITGINPVVIGTTYSDYEFYKKQFKMISLPPQIRDEEFENIKSVYDIELNINLLKNNVSIFEIISRYYKYQFSPDAADLRAAMNKAHAVNQTLAKSNVNIAYEQIFDAEFDKFIKNGILSSFSDSLNEDDIRCKEIKYNLKKLNNFIALASEFGIVLPTSFIFRTLDWSNYRFLDALNADCFLTLVENGYRYISAYEAGKFLLFNYTSDADSIETKEDKLKEKEVETLYDIIKICNWNDHNESLAVISLIRKFSPNSIGKDHSIIGSNDKNRQQHGREWYYYNKYYEQIGNKLLEYADNTPIAVIVASAFLRRSYKQNGDIGLINKSYKHCKAIIDSNIQNKSLSISEEIELFIENCNVIIATFPSHDGTNKGDFGKWNEFSELFQSLIDLYDKSYKLEASVVLDIWHRAIEKRATKKDIALFEQTMYYESKFLSEIQSEYDFNNAIKKFTSICDVFSSNFDVSSYKNANLKGWLLYQQKDSYKLEPSDHALREDELALASKILSIFNENAETKSAVLAQSVLLKTKILCDWIIKFNSLPYAEENPIYFADTNFWKELSENINTYLTLCNDKNPPAAFIKYLKCVHSLVFDDGSYRFEENVRYSKKLSPWYVKRIGVADENGRLLKFVIGTIPQRNQESFRGKISDNTSLFKNLDYIHLSSDVQKYLSEGKLRLSEINSIPDKPVNIFFNAVGATAAIPWKEGGDY